MQNRIRNPNLDLLRAAAISLVVVCHTLQGVPRHPRINRLGNFGGFGVDLFFVLSGWLIGSLYWREFVRFGDVQIGRFIIRRALRTLPPYVVMLGISAIPGHRDFDWRYLLFLQNFYTRIPFFIVSWSLCIEEHFYLVLPFLLKALRTALKHAWVLLVLAGCPILFRALTGPKIDPPFGFYYTATHLRFEGLLLGVWASFLSQLNPRAWAKLKRLSTIGLPLGAFGMLCLLTLLFTGRISPAFDYTFTSTIVAVVFLMLLVFLVDRPPVRLAKSRVVFWIAATSYSIYLTHALAIDLAQKVFGWDALPKPVYVFVILLTVSVYGALLYFLVEVPTLRLRHRLVPGRDGYDSPLLSAFTPST